MKNIQRAKKSVVTGARGSETPEVYLSRTWLARPAFFMRLLHRLSLQKIYLRPLVKTKLSYKLVEDYTPLLYGSVSQILQNIVPDASVYGTHSFRSGGASRAASSARC